MSSIYKKGRDGYFYYQAYIFNPETGKKDKRVFHALSTKDLEEAKNLKISLDLKYARKKYNKNKILDLVKNKNIFYKYFFFITFFLFICFQTIQVFVVKKEPEVNFKLSSGSLDENIKQNDSLYPNIDLIEKKTIQSLGRSEIKTSLKTSQELDPSTISSKVIDFHVEKIDSMPLSFNQVKIFVTIDESSTVNDQKALCLRFKKKYSRFSNIVICLYSKNTIGERMARGYQPSGMELRDKNAWLCMYSYNAIEGEYFDENPGGYLDSY